MELLKEVLFMNDPKNFKCSEVCVINDKYDICYNCKDYEECKNNNPDFCMFLNGNNTKEENLKMCKKCKFFRIGDDNNER